MSINPVPTREQELAEIDRLGAEGFVLQRSDIPQTNRLFLVAMERTGTVEMTVHDAGGNPLEHVSAAISPNVSFPAWSSIMVPWRTWTRETDADGLARFDDVPPNRRLWYTAESSSWRMIEPAPDPTPELAVISGETTHAQIVVARRDAPK